MEMEQLMMDESEAGNNSTTTINADITERDDDDDAGAKSTATKSHPNYALIEALNRHLSPYQGPVPSAVAAAASFNMEPIPFQPAAAPRMVSAFAPASPSTPAVRSEASVSSLQGSLDSGDSVAKARSGSLGKKTKAKNGATDGDKKQAATAPTSSTRKRKLNENNASEALLLLSRDKHFGDLRGDDEDSGNEGRPMQIARV